MGYHFNRFNEFNQYCKYNSLNCYPKKYYIAMTKRPLINYETDVREM